ncbi:ParB N-terminal domain-containing protein [Streptomyces sp. URMC 124]|uniref:ParB N-terminal domain-containing protein n=1 Tax=Streptomyces sp. URMC 124 TaxID=3423405 RepID=UPI003F1BDBC2
MTSPTPYQLLPPLSDEEYAALRADIAENGVRVPIDVDENGAVLDGHHRAWITAELGLDCPRRVVAGLTDEQKRTHALAVNLYRRSLNRAEKRALIQRSLVSDPHLSDRQHAERTGTDHKTVGVQRTQLEGRGEIPHVSERIDTQGRQQPVPRPAARADEADLLAGEDWVEPQDGQFEHLLDASSLGAPHLETFVGPIPSEARARMAERRRPLPEAFAGASHALARAAERLGRLTADDRWSKNRGATHPHALDLLGALKNMSDLVQAMDLPTAATTSEARRWWATSLRQTSDALADVANSLEQENR